MHVELQIAREILKRIDTTKLGIEGQLAVANEWTYLAYVANKATTLSPEHVEVVKARALEILSEAEKPTP